MTASFAAQLDSRPNAMTFVSITIVMMGALMFGIDQCNFGLVHGKQSFGKYWCPKFHFAAAENNNTYCDVIGAIDTHEQPGEWITFNSFGLNLVAFGMALGCLTLAPVSAGRFGRRVTISIGGLTCFLGTMVTAYLASNVTVYYIGRLLTGYGCGMACYCLPMYQSEVATMNIRGLMGSLFQFMVVIGGVIAILLLGIIEDWRQGFMLPGYAGLVVGLAVWLCPESPRFVIDRFGKDAGRPVLQRVRQGDVETELEFLERNLCEERAAGSVSYRDLFTKPGLRLRLFTACYLQAAQQFTGVNAFLGFQNEIFQAAGSTQEQIDMIPGGPAFLLQMTMLAGCILGLLLVDSPFGGRRKQLLGAATLMGPPLVLGAVTTWAGWPAKTTQVMVFIFGFGFQAAWGIIPWFYPAELFTMNERERALSLSTFTGFSMNVVVNQVTLPLLKWNSAWTFFIFGALNITNVIFVLACVRETKGVPLEDIPALFARAASSSKMEDADAKNVPLARDQTEDVP